MSRKLAPKNPPPTMTTEVQTIFEKRPEGYNIQTITTIRIVSVVEGATSRGLAEYLDAQPLGRLALSEQKFDMGIAGEVTP